MISVGRPEKAAREGGTNELLEALDENVPTKASQYRAYKEALEKKAD